MGLYVKIDNLINKRFDELDPDILSVLTRTMMDLEDRIQIYKKELQKGEMYGVTYQNLRKNKKIESTSLIEIYNSI
jgi:hypothetical protein